MSNSMLIHCGLLLLFLSCVRADYSGNLQKSEFSERFSFWPSVHNGATLLRYSRESQAPSDVAGPNEGVSKGSKPSNPEAVPAVPQQVASSTDVSESKNEVPKNQAEVTPTPSQVPGNAEHKEATTVPPTESKEATTLPPPAVNGTAANTTVVEKVKQLNLNNPGVMKRGAIVFGGFALMAVAYFIFYRKKSKNSDPNASTIDANQFRYGVLQSEDKRDNELSRIPLTMDSEDEDDEDLEIFDLEQKKKSLSYVNLQTNDEDIVLSPRENSSERDDLLLDIDDADSTLINWSSNNNRPLKMTHVEQQARAAHTC